VIKRPPAISSVRHSAPDSHNTFGNLPRNALLGPLTWGADLAILKRFQITERLSMQLRGEGYDFLNHNNLADPNTTMSSGDYGKILTRSGNRVIQVGARFIF